MVQARRVVRKRAGAVLVCTGSTMGRDMTEAAEYQPEQPAHSSDTSLALGHLRKLAADLREKVHACRHHGEQPEVEDVHRLRTGTRRVEAMLETLGNESGMQGLDKTAEKARQRWLRQLKKVRRAAGTVRDLDVHRELLAENFLSAETAEKDLAVATIAADAESQSPVALTDQARAFDHWLQKRREETAQELRSILHGRADRLLQAEEQFFASVPQSQTSTRHAQVPTTTRRAVENYLHLMDAMPLLDKENLHDFRKGAKKVRYIAESEADDPAAKSFAKTVKRVQDAIGQWHDWMVLANEAQQALGDEGVILHAELEHRVQRAYERALRVTAKTGREVLGEWCDSLSLRRARPSRSSARTRRR